VSDLSPPPVDGRVQALHAMALRPDEPRARFLVALRRARGRATDRLPLRIDLRDPAAFAAHALGGWWFGAEQGSWTDGPVAQLLVVPGEPPQGAVVVTLQLLDVLVDRRHPARAVTIDVNGAAAARWFFARDRPWERRRVLVVPEAAVGRLAGFLITLRVDPPHRPSPNAGHDLRSRGIALGAVVLGAAAGGERAR
jgi:hypothetical protein